MRTQGRVKVVLGAAAAAALCPALLAGAGLAPASAQAATRTHQAGPAVRAATWGTAMEVPGIAALNAGGDAGIEAMSCATAGNCSAGGFYHDSSERRQLFVVSETNGTWGTATALPGIATLNSGGQADFGQMSCASVGNCTAGGTYRLPHGRTQAFVVTETDGAWGNAMRLPGIFKLNTGFRAGVDAMSCTSPGNCSAGGHYSDGPFRTQVFVANQRNGTWGPAKEIPGTSRLNSDAIGAITSLSCASDGNCSAGGTYVPADGQVRIHVFVVNETNGVWRSAIEIPGTRALNVDGAAQNVHVSCPAPGDCTATGSYRGPSGRDHPFVVDETNGVWGTAQQLPGDATLNQGDAAPGGLACTSPGDCVVTGHYQVSDGGPVELFSAFESNGVWGNETAVPGYAGINDGRAAFVSSTSCGAPGDCSTAGTNVDTSDQQQVFVASETGGRWVTVEEVPGFGALNHRDGFPDDPVLSCGAAGNCGAGGDYTDANGSLQAWVDNES